MRKFAALLLFVMLSVCLQAQLPVPLGTDSTYGVLAGSTVTSTGATVITGDLGLSPGSAVVGFPPGAVSGTQHVADSAAAQAQVDLTAAFLDAQGRLLPHLLGADIGGTVVTPGVYNVPSSLGITGNVTLSGAGVYIFQIPTTLTTASTSQVVLAGGATADNIFWQVGSSATLGTGSIFYGTILAQDSITVTTGAWFNGRALARTGAVTLDNNALTNPAAPGGGTLPPGTPVPPSLILVGIGLASAALYQGRERLRRLLK